MRRILRTAVTLAAAVALTTAGQPDAHAAGKLLVAKTATLGGTHVRFAVVKVGTTVYVRLQKKRHGHWRTVAQDRSDCAYWAGSHDPALDIQRSVRQVFVTWSGPVEGETYAEYGGYRVDAEQLDMYGADGCPGAG